MSLRSIANLPFSRRRLVFAIRVANFTDLRALGKTHADKLQASRQTDIDTDCREYKILSLRRKVLKSIFLFRSLQGPEVGIHSAKLVVNHSHTT
jgi:hypothetical protein